MWFMTTLSHKMHLIKRLFNKKDKRMNSQRVFKIASVCGSGYATSGWIATKLTDALEEHGIKAEIKEVKVMDLAMVVDNYDLVVSASELSDIYGVPVVASSSIITGLGFEDTLNEILDKLKEVENKNK